MVCGGLHQPNLDENREVAAWAIHCNSIDRYAWDPVPQHHKWKSIYIRTYTPTCNISSFGICVSTILLT